HRRARLLVAERAPVALEGRERIGAARLRRESADDEERERVEDEKAEDRREGDDRETPGRHRCGWSARYTFSAVTGSEVTRAPTASWTAFAIAGAMPGFASSPTDLAPNGPSPWSPVRSTTRGAGTSACVGIL